MSDSNESESIVLSDRQDQRGGHAMWARRRDDGALIIEGQDLGPGVERAFGAGLTEYEWVWEIAPQNVSAAVEALGGHEADDPLALLRAWSADHPGEDPGSYLKDAGVPIDFWNRIGD